MFSARPTDCNLPARRRGAPMRDIDGAISRRKKLGGDAARRHLARSAVIVVALTAVLAACSLVQLKPLEAAGEASPLVVTEPLGPIALAPSLTGVPTPPPGPVQPAAPRIPAADCCRAAPSADSHAAGRGCAPSSADARGATRATRRCRRDPGGDPDRLPAGVDRDVERARSGWDRGADLPPAEIASLDAGPRQMPRFRSESRART